MVLVMKTLITLHRVSSHLIQPLEICFILYLLKDLVNRLLEYSTNYLGSSSPSLSSKISLGPTIIIPLQSEILSVLGNYFSLPLSLLLILLNPLILINSIHELTYVSGRFFGQRLP